jgi:hypothetical protein
LKELIQDVLSLFQGEMEEKSSSMVPLEINIFKVNGIVGFLKKLTMMIMSNDWAF